MRLAIVLTALLTLSHPATAEEESRMMFVRGGILCNTQTELETLLTGIHLADGQMPENIPEGCGQFSPRGPIPMLVTPLGWYETPSVRTHIARFVAVQNGWTQYGYIAYEPVPPDEKA